jgi:hypothetical protein
MRAAVSVATRPAQSPAPSSGFLRLETGAIDRVKAGTNLRLADGHVCRGSENAQEWSFG